MAKSIHEIASEMADVSHSPDAMARIVLKELEDGGKSIMHPSDPVLFAIESSVVAGHASMQAVQNALPKVFASMALTTEDVYRHISDKDARNIFALPSTTTFNWLFDVEELRSLSKPIPNSDIKKVTIPVNTEYRAKDVVFSQPYPLEIRFLPHDGIQVRWDNSYENPFTKLASGSLEYEVSQIPYEGGRRNLIRIPTPVEQYRTKHYTSNTVPNIVWSETYVLSDSFYGIRVRYRNRGNWVTLRNALSIETIDPLTPTVVIEPTDGRVRLTIPEIYINAGMVSGEVSVEVIETRGEEVINFNNYLGDDFTYAFKDNLQVSNTLYTNVFKQVSLAQVFAQGTTQGGRNALPFEKLRQRVIRNTLGAVKTPVTTIGLEDKLSDNGYEVYKVVDMLGSRVYLAALELPASNISTISGPIGCANDTVHIGFEELSNHPAVKVNGNRFTLTDECLFIQRGNNTHLFADHTVKTLRWLSNVDKIEYLKDKRLLTLPYHVVLDTNNNIIESRVYALSNPKVLSRQLETTNDSVKMTVSTAITELVMTERGYRLRVKTKSNADYKALDHNKLDAILSFDGSTGRVFKRGTLIGQDTDDEYLWEWEIETNLDIDRNHQLIVDGFTNNNNLTFDMGVDLTSEFNIAYALTGSFDSSLSTSADEYTREDYQGLAMTHEKHLIQFGRPLDNMWAYSRPVPGTLQYEKYKEDVPAVYSQDVIRFKEVVDGEPVFETTHKAGDPIYEADGSPRIRYTKGMVVQKDGQPVLKNARRLEIESDLWLVDARFKVTTAPEINQYNEFWFNHIISHSLTTIPEIAKNTLDRTRLMLTAKNTISRVRVMLGNEVITNIPAEQKFSVRYFVTREVRQNQELLRQIKTITNRVINDVLAASDTISTVGIGEALKRALSDYVKDVTVNEFELAYNTKYFSVLDVNARIGIAKRLVLTTDNNLTIEDDISITYVNYRK